MAKYQINNQQEPINFEISNDPTARALQNCKNLLMTKMGEVPYDRYRGFDWALYHLPIDQMRSALMPELDRMMKWEPDAKVISASADLNAKKETVITVIVEIKG
ncbi:MAG: hypothetical protein IKN04_08790 [Clostridia bacterium]|nr:hypothetical protein [Clostridia bacterium]